MLNFTWNGPANCPVKHFKVEFDDNTRAMIIHVLHLFPKQKTIHASR